MSSSTSALVFLSSWRPKPLSSNAALNVYPHNNFGAIVSYSVDSQTARTVRLFIGQNEHHILLPILKLQSCLVQ